MFRKIQVQWLSLMAHVYIQQRKFSRAVPLLEAANVLQPKHFEICRALAFSYLHSKQSEACLNTLEYWIKNPVSNLDRHYLYRMQGQAYWQLKKSDQARNAFSLSQKYSLEAV